MATKGKSTKKSESAVVRIRASDTPPAKKTALVKQPKKAAAPKTTKETTKRKNPFVAIGGYFKGAWQELRQVRWPNRQATWSMTAALLVFTAFFVALILLLDALFKYIFQLILG